MFDLIIVGAGPAGITASVYAARKRMNFLVITKDIGGQAALSADIENYTGYQFISGVELTAKFEDHMRKYNVSVREGEEVTEVKKVNNTIKVTSTKGNYLAKTAVIASGKRSRELNVVGEKEFKNRGLSYCATCDGPLFADKTVAVIGGGNSALDACLQLTKIAKSIYLINISPELGGDPIMKEKVIEDKKISILNNSSVAAILGDKMVKAIKVKSGHEEKVFPVEGVFVEIGLIPNSEFVKDVEKNSQGEIKVNLYNETNIEGIFAAGDVTNVPEKQIIIAAGEGAKAVLSVSRYLAQRR